MYSVHVFSWIIKTSGLLRHPIALTIKLNWSIISSIQCGYMYKILHYPERRIVSHNGHAEQKEMLLQLSGYDAEGLITRK